MDLALSCNETLILIFVVFAFHPKKNNRHIHKAYIGHSTFIKLF